jgi:type VI secretion system protein VasG
MHIDLKVLIEKLNPPCRQALEAAAGLCVAQAHYSVELVHFLVALLEQSHSDFRQALRIYTVETAVVRRELTQTLERLPRGNTRTPALSPTLVTLLQNAWMLTSLQLGEPLVRSGAVLLALLTDEHLHRELLDTAKSLMQIPGDALQQKISDIMRGSGEGTPGASPVQGEVPRVLTRLGSSSGSAALEQYTIDLTARARAGAIDPILGRDAEILQIIDILTRRRQNNPILTGEAGVGKTAVVEGFARRLAAGAVPPVLRQVSVRALDLGLLQAGAGVKGEFEQRLKAVIAEVTHAPDPIILFIDEAHTLIGAGGLAGQGDAANLLKPALARGELRTIAATTWAEYKRYFEKEAALARRFQVVQVEEPDEAAAVAMLRGSVAHLERHHQVRILDEAVRDAVKLSQRYISGRHLPDKAIGVLDTACARVALGQNSTPAALGEAQRRMEHLETEYDMLQREQRMGAEHTDRLAALTAELQQVQERQQALTSRWRKELDAVQHIQGLQQGLEGLEVSVPDAASERARLLAALHGAQAELASLQGETPMVPLCVDARVVATVIADWTGIPLGKMHSDEIATMLHLKDAMAHRIVGQPQALDALCRRMHTFRADLVDPGKPVGVFLLVGPSGVGKTETALALADLLYGGERSMVVVNMSEYQEAHTVSALKGAPPGYVGYGKGGILTEAVRRNPYSVVLLDEVEKAHPDVIELFYQVFDKGVLEDSEGVAVNFKHTVILLTSNLGAETIIQASQEAPTAFDAERLVELVRPALLRHFKPALLGRLVIVPYLPLDEETLQAIVRLKLAAIQQRFHDRYRADLYYDSTLVTAITARCTDVESGARTIDRMLTQTLLPELAGELLKRLATGETFASVQVSCERNGHFVYRFATSSSHAPSLLWPRPGQERASRRSRQMLPEEQRPPAPLASAQPPPAGAPLATRRARRSRSTSVRPGEKTADDESGVFPDEGAQPHASVHTGLKAWWRCWRGFSAGTHAEEGES